MTNTTASTATVLTDLLTAQGRSPRDGQIDAAAVIDSGELHVALQAPTGVGKSALAIAAAIAAGGGMVAMHSNGLIAQYAEEFDSWHQATGKRIASLVGKAHYWCKVASPDLNGLTPAQQVHVRRTGSFIGAGIEQRDYVAHSVLAVAPVIDEDASEEDEDAVAKSPCLDCPIREAKQCPLWIARGEAMEADVVVTNATMLGVALGGAVTWATESLKPLIVLDEAHADIEPLAAVLGKQITIKGDEGAKAAGGLDEALDIVHEWAGDDEHPNAKKARKFLAAVRNAREEGRKVLFSVEDDKVVLTIPADLRSTFADKRVLAMSATLSQRNVDALGLDTKVVNLQGLDVSASTVFLDETAPKWEWVGGDRAAHLRWAKYTAAKVEAAFRNGGATLALFVSRDDLNSVVALLPSDVQAATLHYYSGVDRQKTIETYKANPTKHLLVGCVSGAGTGVNLPGDLLRTVIVARVPQNPRKGVDRAAWAEDTRAAVVQSVGRAHRFDGDWGHVHIVGGFGARKDVRKSLEDLGWVIK
jgi:Rad3-related DNA helicase